MSTNNSATFNLLEFMVHVRCAKSRLNITRHFAALESFEDTTVEVTRKPGTD